MVKQAEEIAAIAKNIVIKIPMIPEGLKAVPILEKEKKIKTNVTMIFSSTQSYLAMKSGASYISIVLSRLDAIANESDVLVNDAAQIKNTYGFASEIIAGSMKTQNHILSCLRAGVDIVTIPDDLFFLMFKHPLTDMGLAGFKKDWEKVPK
jgi:transaldolase